MKNAVETFDFVKNTLQSEGYLEDTHKMVHDYLHYMIMDLMDQEGTAYISEDEIKEDALISRFLFGLTQ